MAVASSSRPTGRLAFLCLLMLRVSVAQQQGIPPALISTFKEQVLHPGAALSVGCVASGNPPPQIDWSLDGTALLKEHVKWTEKDGKVSSWYNVTDVETEDGGVYRCLATNKVGEISYEARINVHGPLSSRIRPPLSVVSGTSIWLNCPIYGYPMEYILWEKGGQPLPASIQEVLYENGTLHVSRVQRGSDDGEYMCTATNSQGETAQGMVQINVMMAPQIVPFAFQEDLIREGLRARVQCVINEGDLPLSIRWLKDGQPLSSQESLSVRNLDEYSSILSISSVSPRHNGNYTCVATNAAATTSHTAILAVNVAPKILPFAFQDDQFFKGMRAYIICAVTQGDTPLHFQWLKDGKPIPPSLGVVTRNMDDHANSLSIESVSSIHTGNYTCLVNNEASTVSHTALLLVYVAPKIVPFSFQQDHVFEGVLARVSCVVYQGDLPLILDWFKDGSPISGDISIRAIDQYSSILTIEIVQRRHAGNYTCRASNSAAATSHSAQLIVNVPPKIVPFTFSHESLLEGMFVRVSCVISRGDLPLNITWLKDGHFLSTGQNSVSIRDFDEYSSVLSIDPVTTDHSGNYTCVAKNHAAVAHYSANLLVKVPPRWIITPANKVSIKGKATTLDCKAEGFPQPEIQWLKVKGSHRTGQRIPIRSTGRDRINVLPNGTLAIRETSEQDEGYYFCIAQNGVGKGLSQSLFLDIHAPVRFDAASKNTSVHKGVDALITCEAKGDLPINFTWTVNKRNILAPQNKRIKLTFQGNVTADSAISELTISNVKQQDSSVYMCTAKNEYGNAEYFVNLIVQEPPSTPVITKAESVANRSIQIWWSVPSDGGSPLTVIHLLYGCKAQGDKEPLYNVTLLPTQTTAIMRDLIPAQQYTIRLAASNGVGISDFSGEIEITTSEEVPNGAPRKVQVESIDKRSLRITWQPPEKHLQNGILRGYHVGYKIKGSNESYTFEHLDIPEDYAEDLIYQVSDLQMYSQYSIVVQAYNSKGRGPLSPEVVVMTSEDVPSESPQNLRCSSLSTHTIYIIWDQIRPEFVNGILRGYKVFYKPMDEWYESSFHTKKTDLPKLTLQGLEVNTNYSLQVAGMTRMGDGVKSEPIYCKTHEDVPSAPGDIKALPTSSESMLVAWKAPTKPNGAVVKYNVYVRSIDDEEGVGSETRYSKDASPRVSDAISPDALVHSSPTDLVLEVMGLQKDHRYDVWVTAVSAIGEGPRSRIVSQAISGPTVSAKSASFDDIISTPWKKDLILSCQAVGNPPPKKTWLLGGQDLPKQARIQVAADGTLFIRQLQREDSGNYTCVLKNQYGSDEIKYALQVLVPPSPPKLGVFAKTMSSFHLKWQQGMTGGDPIRGYILHFKREGSQWEKRELPSDQDSFFLDSLSCGATYQLYMEAFNNIGIGEPCEVITISTDGEVISAPPKDQIVREGPTFLSLHLDAWPSGGCPIQRFTAEYRHSSSPNEAWKKVSDPSSLQKRLLITGLVPATRYHVRITVQTSGGPTIAEYSCATLTTTGGTLAPDHVTEGESDRTVIWLSLDPTLLLAAASVLVLFLLIILIFVCVCMCRKQPSKPRSKRGVQDPHLENYVMSMQGMDSYPPSFYSTLNRRVQEYDDDPSPYATSTVGGFSLDTSRHSSVQPPPFEHSRNTSERNFDNEDVSGYSNAAIPVPPLSAHSGTRIIEEQGRKSVPVTPRKNNGQPETLFVFPSAMETGALNNMAI